MGGGAFEPKTVARVSKKAFYKKKKKAFTLAEVLITLAIIGVVAALTIPTVVAKYQQKMYYSQFMKTYNTIVNAFNLSIAENGEPDTWAFDEDNPEDTTEKYLMPYLKVNNICTEDDLLTCVSETFSDLTNRETVSIDEMFYGNVLTLADGSAINISYRVGGKSKLENVFVTIDTNGKKTPNILGRDIFSFRYFLNYPYKWEWDYGYYKSGNYEGYASDGYGGYASSNCDSQATTVGGSGSGCAGRLLEEGAMNY